MPVTAALLGRRKPFSRDTKWLGDSHGGLAAGVPASGCGTCLCLGQWSKHGFIREFTRVTSAPKMNTSSVSGVEIFILLIDSGSASDVRATCG